jgi:hypothetical protein
MATKADKTTPLQMPLKPRPPEKLPVIAPPGFALPEKLSWSWRMGGGKKSKAS